MKLKLVRTLFIALTSCLFLQAFDVHARPDCPPPAPKRPLNLSLRDLPIHLFSADGTAEKSARIDIQAKTQGSENPFIQHICSQPDLLTEKPVDTRKKGLRLDPIEIVKASGISFYF